MTADAEDWGAHDLDRRFGLGPARDEITGLAATLDGLLARIASSRRHEQRFASEVAHELRTPIAGMRGRAELALGAPGPDADAEREAALSSIVDAGGARGRRDRRARRGRPPRARSGGRHGRPGGDRARARGSASTRPQDCRRRRADAEIARRIVAALVDNARRHGDGEVRIELSAAGGRVRLAVRDDGPGLDPALGESAFEPGVRGERSAGAGLGLPLARRLARSCGGDVIACPGPAAASRWSCPAWARTPDPAHRSGCCKVIRPTMRAMTATYAATGPVVRPADAEQGARGHPVLLDHQDHVHHGRGDRGGLPQRQSRLRPDEHDLPDGRAARGPAARPVPAAPLRAGASTGRSWSSSASSAR